ncbi:hypothetical protein GcC1_211028 [Golovinomyces cichoracearum]|uniref:Uncharacterized protein n=1 Tax=Golovinomyces cichoracearum TaxID=62708 RepID=A0A420HAM1_9PEZI|nr:hypothetical protein GcC1_211028 [Golovinomyces cichoracearum]
MFVRNCIILCLLLRIAESRLLYHRSLKAELPSVSASFHVPEPRPIVNRSSKSSINSKEELSNSVHNSELPASDISKRAFRFGNLLKGFTKPFSKIRRPIAQAKKPVVDNASSQKPSAGAGVGKVIADTGAGAIAGTGGTAAVKGNGNKDGVQANTNTGGQTNALQGGDGNSQRGNGGGGNTGAIIAGGLASSAPLLAVNGASGGFGGGAGGPGVDPSLAGAGAGVGPTLTDSGTVDSTAAKTGTVAAPGSAVVAPGSAAPGSAVVAPGSAAPVSAVTAPAVGRRAVVGGASKFASSFDAQNKNKLQGAREKSLGVNVSRAVKSVEKIKRKRRVILEPQL